MKENEDGMGGTGKKGGNGERGILFFFVCVCVVVTL